MKHFIHAFLFYMSWAACLLGALNEAVWIGFSVSITSCVIAVLISSPRRRVDFFRVIVIICLGFVLEAVNMHLRLYSFVPESTLPPAWLLSFWPAFSILFLDILKFFNNRAFVYKFIAGFTGGAGYWAGQWLALIEFREDKYVMMFVFAMIWAVEFMLLLWVNRIIDSYAPVNGK